MMKKLFIVITLVPILYACSDEIEGHVVVTNVDTTPGNNIERIYISYDCTDGWGAPDASGLSIAEGQSSQPFRVEEKIAAVPLPLPYDDHAFEIAVDVRACFTSGTCSEITYLYVEEDKVKVVYMDDDGRSEIPAYCL